MANNRKVDDLRGLADRLQKYRKSAGLTVKNLASESGRFPTRKLTTNQISSIENHRRADIGFLRLTTICQIIDVPISALLIDIDQPFQPCEIPGLEALTNYDAMNNLWSWAQLSEQARRGHWAGLTEKSRSILGIVQHFHAHKRLSIIRYSKVAKDIKLLGINTVQESREELSDIQRTIDDCTTDLKKLRGHNVRFAQALKDFDIELWALRQRVDALLDSLDSETIKSESLIATKA